MFPNIGWWFALKILASYPLTLITMQNTEIRKPTPHSVKLCESPGSTSPGLSIPFLFPTPPPRQLLTGHPEVQQPTSLFLGHGLARHMGIHVSCRNSHEHAKPTRRGMAGCVQGTTRLTYLCPDYPGNCPCAQSSHPEPPRARAHLTPCVVLRCCRWRVVCLRVISLV